MYKTITDEEFLKMINKHRLFNGYDLSKNNISSFVIKEIEFINCKFKNILDCSFFYCDFDNCIFDGIEHSNFNNSLIRGCNFRYSFIINLKFEFCELFSCNFYNAKIVNDIVFNDCYCENSNLFLSLQCPEDGSFIGYKKIKDLKGEYICKLLIPEDAKRSSATTRKCRCSKAKVLEIINIRTHEKVKSVHHYCTYNIIVYSVGEFVYPDSFDENRWNECSHGIHFYITKQEALNHEF